jgi:uncharacterized protein (DUF433 family)
MPLDLRRPVLPLRRDSHGVIRVGGTRVTLESVLAAYREGESAEGILERFPSLDLAGIHATLAWYLGHLDEAESYLERSRVEGDANRARAERRAPASRLLARLRARRRR